METDCTEAEADALHAQAQNLIDSEFSEKNAPKPTNALWHRLKICIVVLIFVVNRRPCLYDRAYRILVHLEVSRAHGLRFY
jgi:hypothetical protein